MNDTSDTRPAGVPEAEAGFRNARIYSFSLLLLCIALLIALGVFLSYCLFPVPHADDYIYKTLSRNLGVMKGFLSHWRTLNGRVTGIFMLLSVYQAVDFFSISHTFVLLFFCLLLIASCFLFVRLPGVTPTHPKRWILLSALLAATFWSTSPSPGTTFYWLPDATQTPLAIFLFAILLHIGLNKSALPRKLLPGIPVCFLFSVTHELYTLIGIYILMCILLFSWLRKRRVYLSSPWIFFIATMVVGFLLVALAPGTAQRVESTEGWRNADAWQTIMAAAATTAGTLASWVAKPLLSAYLLLVLFFSLRWRRDIIGDEIRLRDLIILIPAIVVGVFLAILGVVLAAGPDYFLPRIESVLYFSFLVSLTVLVLKLNLNRPYAPSPRIIAFAVLIYIVTLFSAFNLRVGITDLANGSVADYYSGMKYLHNRLLSAGSGIVAVPSSAFPPNPRLLPRHDIRRDATHWRNQSVALYYRLDGLKVDTE